MLFAEADPVAYFTEGRYIAGTADHTYEWADATWQFSSAENRDLFASNPDAVCASVRRLSALGLSLKDTLHRSIPNAWKIVDGKLYLNYDARIQQRWQQDVSLVTFPGLIKTGQVCLIDRKNR